MTAGQTLYADEDNEIRSKSFRTATKGSCGRRLFPRLRTNQFKTLKDCPFERKGPTRTFLKSICPSGVTVLLEGSSQEASQDGRVRGTKPASPSSSPPAASNTSSATRPDNINLDVAGCGDAASLLSARSRL